MRTPPPVEQLEREIGFARSLARGLLSDEHLADDVVQQTWLTFLERPPPDARRLGAWFHTVSRNISLKGLRTIARRRRREQVAARREAEPGAAEVVERATLLGAVAEAVSALDEPYRRTMMQRYYEAMPPRAIAAREGVPVATVRSRIQRAHAQLRARLDGTFADRRRAFGLALAGLAEGRAPTPAPPPQTPTTRSARRLVTLNRATWWLAPGLVAATVAVLPRLLTIEDDLDPGFAPRTAQSVVAEPPPLAGSPAREPDAAAAPNPLDRPDDAPAWLSADDVALRVLVRRALDGTPVAGVTVRASDGRESLADPSAVTATTDDGGVAWLVGVAPGRLTVGTDRGGRSVAEVVGPGVTSTALEIPLGVTVRGEVIDVDGRTVAGAVVWCSGGSEHEPGTDVALTDARGRFTIVDLPPDRRIAARSKGHAVSPVRFVGAPPGARLDGLLLTLGAEGVHVGGRVVGPDGFPLAGATVRIVRRDARVPVSPDGHDAPATPPFDGVSDHEGRFAADGLPPGRHELLVVGEGAAPIRLPVDVRAGMTPLTVRLQRGARVVGHVEDESGAPLAGVVVRVAGSGGAPFHPATVSDLAGRFELGAIPAGAVRLRAEAAAGGANRDFEFRDGDVEAWRVTLPSGHRITGRVTDPAGGPLSGLRVIARPSDGAPPEAATTDADGRFVIDGCARRPHGIAAYRAGDVLPVAVGVFDVGVTGELSLRATPIADALSGRLVTTGGAPIEAEVCVAFVGPAGADIAVTTRTGPEGDFEFRDLPPATVRVEARAPGFGVVDLGRHELSAGRGTRLGVRTVPRSGRLLLAAPKETRVAFVRSSERAWCAVSLTEGAAEVEVAAGDFVAVLVQGTAQHGSLGAGEVLPVTLVRPIR